MRWSAKNPWRCWERHTLAGVLNGPEDLLVRVALYDTNSRVYQSEFRWPALVRLGPTAYDGSYAQITLRFADLKWSFEMAADGERTYLLVRPLGTLGPGTKSSPDSVQLRLETVFQPEASGRILAREEEVVAIGRDRAWSVRSLSPAALRNGSTITAPLTRPFLAIVEPAGDAGQRLEQRTEAERKSAGPHAPLTPDERAAADIVARARAAYFAKFAYVPREFWWAYSAIPYGIGWNVIWAADRREPIAVCSRDWCVHGNYGAWVLFNWDQFFLVPAAADYDRALAHQIIRPQMDVQTAEGLIPGIASPLGVAADRGMPPVAALGLWKAYLRTGDRSFVADYYDGLCRYHAWWRRNRDGNGDGLLEWGSNPTRAPHPQWQAHTYWASRYETGMDNHPMWDDVRWNPDTNTQEQADVGLNGLHAASALCLAHMSKLLGHAKRAERFAAEAADMAGRIDQRLWNDSVGLWLSRDWNGAWNLRASPCCFYPMLAPGLDPRHAQRAVDEHLRNPKRFGGRYLMPVSPRDDPAYAEQYYVRGRIWPEQGMLAHLALREAGHEQAAGELARGMLETMKAEWLDEGHLHENYNAETADSEDTAESDPLYSFGPMMTMAAWHHLRDVTIDGREVKAPLESLRGHLDADGALARRIDDPALTKLSE